MKKAAGGGLKSNSNSNYSLIILKYYLIVKSCNFCLRPARGDKCEKIFSRVGGHGGVDERRADSFLGCCMPELQAVSNMFFYRHLIFTSPCDAQE